MVKFFWETDDKELDARIVDAFVNGNQGQFIQEVLGGKVMLLPEATFEMKKAFAVRVLTQNNMGSINQAEIEAEIQIARQQLADQAAQMDLPELICHPQVTSQVTKKAKRR